MSMPTVPISRMQVSQGTCFPLLSAICGFKIIVGGEKLILCWGFFGVGMVELLGLPFFSIILCHCSACQCSVNNKCPALCWGLGINSVLPKRGQLKQECCGYSLLKHCRGGRMLACFHQLISQKYTCSWKHCTLVLKSV